MSRFHEGELVLSERDKAEGTSRTTRTTERKFYGTMPSVLPKTLPVGTRWKGHFDTYTIAVAATLNSRTGAYECTDNGCARGGGECRDQPVYAMHFLWDEIPIEPSASPPEKWEPKRGDFVEGLTAKESEHGENVEVRGWLLGDRDASTVFVSFQQEPLIISAAVKRDSLRPISPPPAGSADAPSSYGAEAREEPVGGGSSTKDPYAERRLALDTGIIGKNHDGLTEAQREQRKEQSNGDAFDRLAADRRRHLDETKKELDRPVSSHPREWPENASDEQELCVTF